MENKEQIPNRVDGWEDRLRSVFTQWSTLPFVWGSSDCFCFAGTCVEALTGSNPMERFKGTYETEEEARKLFSDGLNDVSGRFYKADDMIGYVRLVMGQEKPIEKAQRGDVVFCDGGPHFLGVVSMNSNRIACMNFPRGMIFLPTRLGKIAWTV